MPDAFTVPGHGLPGKNIKLSNQVYASTTPSTIKSQGRANHTPLGITINTNVQHTHRPPPPQLFAPVPPNFWAASTSTLPRIEKTKKIPPKPLVLERHISPFDRQIPIALSLKSPKRGSTPSYGRGLTPQHSKTPKIVITPVEEEFGESSPLPHPHQLFKPRAPSSVYSPNLVGVRYGSTVRDARYRSSSTSTIFEDAPRSSPSSTFNSLSSRRSDRISLESVLPTPLRDVGWWNLITSPLPNKTGGGSSQLHRKQSPSTPDEETPLIEKTRSAVIARDQIQHDSFVEPWRKEELVNGKPFFIYDVPSSGEAAAYYDLTNDFETPLIGAGRRESEHPSDVTGTTRSESTLSWDELRLPVGPLAPKKVDGGSRNVPPPQHPAQTPPISACAAIVGSIWDSKLDDDNVHLSSPSPTVAVASLHRLQQVKGAELGSDTRDFTPPSAVENVQSKSQERGAFPALKIHEEPAQLPSSNLNRATQEACGDRTVSSSKIMEMTIKTSAANAVHKYLWGSPAGNHSQTEKQLGSPFETPVITRKKKILSHHDTLPVHHVRSTTEKSTGNKIWRICPHISRGCTLLTVVGIGLTSVVLFTIVLSLLLVNRHASVPVEAQWVNVTGFPPLPTGVSTVSGPALISNDSGCVAMRSMWSCSLPKEQQNMAPSNGFMPNFRFSILYNKDSISNTSLLKPISHRRAIPYKPTDTSVFIDKRRAMLQVRNTFQDMAFSSNPSPPKTEEQRFLGNATDKNASPYEGDLTPFYITLLPTSVPNVTLLRRTYPDSSFTNLTGKIPPPIVLENGTIGPALLYPFPSAQPLRLFNRGLSSEHYGFYQYFSRSIFVASPTSAPSSATNNTESVNDNGGATLVSADTVCVWSQTRFLVQIWTRSHVALFSSIGGGYAVNRSMTDGPSAFDFKTPGSFPWPVTITIDRHGGDSQEKGIYCYGLDDGGKVNTQQKVIREEDRGSGGSLVNPAPGPFAKGDTKNDYGGFDGGSGGCKCQYVNWQSN